MGATYLLCIVSAMLMLLTVEGAFKPGWEPALCLSEYLRPTNISIERDESYPGFLSPDGTWFTSNKPQKFHVYNKARERMEPFFPRGVGYSPIPPSKTALIESFDRFTSEYRFLWERDLDRIKAAGGNTIRVWSWDSFSDHSDFLDVLYDKGLYIMVPFLFSPSDYKILANPATRSQVLTDWKAFVTSVMHHPSVLALLIGNELDRDYGDQQDELFALVNQMIRIRDEIDYARHPVTMPLSDISFVKAWSNPYYQWSAMDFWSLQTYREPQYIQLPIQEYYYSYLENMTKLDLAFKPLVLTEFGADALPIVKNGGTWPPDGRNPKQPPEDQTKQAKLMCQMFSQMRKNVAFEISYEQVQFSYAANGMSPAGVIGGSLVMEWNDEWWKGTSPDVRAPMCPNQRPELHTWCATDVGRPQNPYYLHEEWLGLNSQVYDPSGKKFCICPRKALGVVSTSFDCNGNESCIGRWLTLQNGVDYDGFGCQNGVEDLYRECDVKWCGARRNLFLNPYISLIAPVMVISVVIGCIVYWIRRRDKRAAELAELTKENETADDPPVTENPSRQEESIHSMNARKLRNHIAESFLKYCNVGTTDRLQLESVFCPYFCAAQERLFHLIWDKYLTFDTVSEPLLTTATRIIYEQYMEAYFLWINTPPTTHIGRDDMIQDLALYNIVQAWAGTINHCPEKICQVFEFAKDYFAHCVSRNHSALRVIQIQNVHHGLVEIFRVYYLKVDEGEFTFEDVNTDAVHFMHGRAKDPEKKIEFWREEGERSPKDDGSIVEPQRQRDPDSVLHNTGQDCPELDLLPEPELKRRSDGTMSKGIHPFLEYHKQRNPEEMLLSDAAQTFFRMHEEFTNNKWLPKKEAFPQKGGPFTLIFNFGWVIRYLLWQSLWAVYLQPVSIRAPMCLCDAVMILAITDASWMFFSSCLHYRIIERFTKRIMFEMGLYGGCLGVVILANIVPALHKPVDSPHRSSSNAFGMGYTINTFYIIGAALVAFVEELRLLSTPDVPTYPIRGRFVDTRSIRIIRIAFFLTLIVFSVCMLLLKIPGLIVPKVSYIHHLDETMYVPVVDNLFAMIWWFGFVVGSCGLSYVAAKVSAVVFSDPLHKEKSLKKGKEEAKYLVLNFLYWTAFAVSNWFLAYSVMIPAISNITFAICVCDENNPSLDETQLRMCKESFSFTCYVAVLFVWLSASLIGFVVLYAVFEMLLLVFGLVGAKMNRVGNVQTWQDVEKSYEVIHDRCMKKVSSCMEYLDKQQECWNGFINALYDDYLLNEKEKNDLSVSLPDKRVPNFKSKPRSAEAIRRIVYHLWSLESALAHDSVGGDKVNTPFRKCHRVRTMPTWTCVVPAYNETVVFEEEQLTSARTIGTAHLRITEIEYLVHTFPDEWDNFAERMKKLDGSWVLNADSYAMDLVNSYVNIPGHPRLNEQIKFEIRWWATMRGQTLARTIAGIINWRLAILHLLRLEEDGITEEEAQRIVARKCQLVVSHQTYNPKKDIYKSVSCPSEESLEICFRRLKYFDLVYNNDGDFQSMVKRLKFDATLTADGKEDVRYTKTITVTENVKGKIQSVERKMYNYYPKEAFEILTIQRVGRLKIGEGKAENQMHALQFVNGMVLQAVDMNQYATFENGYKVPYLLGDYFGTPSDMRGEEAWDSSAIIPQYRILGFPEWAYTRSLSLVGEMMGAAEWCFVTITHRVLDWPLRIRAHYGHPDFFDCFWVRNRGGQSKASPLVNTNEDIFAGYEMIGRGDRGAFVEFIEAQKGRETSFGGAFTFEAKLAQGGAQQCRSFDVYRLNRGLDLFSRFSLFFTSLAFYIANLLMAVSINYYILSIALFAISGVTYHKLGLLDAVIAVPWLVQIGYALALPYIVELTIQKGFWRAIGEFVKTLPPSIIFFIFHLRTKCYFFTQGLLVGRGGYAGTGRGFGLHRSNFTQMYKAYSESHYYEACLIFFVLLIYGIYGSDPPGAYFLRCITIILIAVSWLWAPILFNPAPTTQDLQHDVTEILDWATNQRREEQNLEELKDRLKKIHFQRLHGLVHNLVEECKESLPEFDETRSVRHDPISKETATVADTVSQFGGVTNALMEGEMSADLTNAVRAVYNILIAQKTKLMKRVKMMDRIPDASPTTTLDQIVKTYWADSEDVSWTGWYQKSVVLMSWEGEDMFFPGLINLMAQKMYLSVEVFLPWIVLCLDQWHVDSVYFMVLVVMAIAISYFVDFGFREHHEFTTLAKGTLLLTLPMAGLYFHYGTMTFSQLFWSLTMYFLVISLCIRAFFGIINAKAKHHFFGWRGNPYHLAYDAFKSTTDHANDRLQTSVKNRTQEMEKTNVNEMKRLSLFQERMKFIRFVTVFRGVIPLLCTVILAVGNAITVVLSEWITTLNFNGRVNEAWKKAYLRPVISTNDRDTGKGPGGGGANEPLNRNTQVAQDEVASAAAAVYGSISSSLQPTNRRGMRSGKHFSRAGTAIPMPGAGPQSSRTLMSVGSLNSQMAGDNLHEPLLSQQHQHQPTSAGDQRNAIHFLASMTDKYGKGQEPKSAQ